MKKLLITAGVLSTLVACSGGEEEQVPLASMEDLLHTKGEVKTLEGRLQQIRDSTELSKKEVEASLSEFKTQFSQSDIVIVDLQEQINAIRMGLVEINNTVADIKSDIVALERKESRTVAKKKRETQLGFNPASLNKLGKSYVLAVGEYGSYTFHRVGDQIMNGWSLSGVESGSVVVFKHASGNEIRKSI